MTHTFFGGGEGAGAGGVGGWPDGPRGWQMAWQVLHTGHEYKASEEVV